MNKNRVLIVEIVGFCLLIAVSWMNELSDFGHIIFPGYHGNWREAVIETSLIILVALPTLYLTKRLLDRLHYLEGFLRICAWCKRLDCNGEWVKVEDYFRSEFSMESTHGICPECHAEQLKKI